MFKKIFGICLGLVVTFSLVSADYYMVNPNGKMCKAEKIGKGFKPVNEGSYVTLGDFPKGPGFVDTTNLFDPTINGYYFPNRDSNTIIMQYFNSQFACSLIAVGFDLYSAGTAEANVWAAPNPWPDSAGLEAWMDTNWVYDTLTNNWDTLPTVVAGPESIISAGAGITWFTLPTKIDIGTDYVCAGFRLLTHDGNPNPLSDGYADPDNGFGVPHFWPCQTWMYRIRTGYAKSWISYGYNIGDWCFYYVIDIYENAPPSITSMDKLPGTYITADRPVTATFYDFGVPSDSSGTSLAYLLYWVDGDTTNIDTVPMVITPHTAGQPVDTGTALIPGQTATKKVTYCIVAVDYQGAATVSSKVSYTVGAGTAGNILLVLESDAYYGAPYSPDALSSVYPKTDIWNEKTKGKADSSIFAFYTSGAGQKVIFWSTWGGYSFAADTAYIKAFLDAGGKLAIGGQDIFAEGKLGNTMTDAAAPYGAWTADSTSFAYRYMKVCSGFDDYYGGDTLYAGIADTMATLYGCGEEISNNLSTIYVYPLLWSGYGANYCGRFDSLTDGAAEVFVNEVGSKLGYKYSGTYKLVALYWPYNNIALQQYDSVGLGTADSVSQGILMLNILGWFGIGVEENASGKLSYSISEVMPNPAKTKGNSCISFSTPKTEKVTLKVYDLSGALVTTLVDKVVTPGTHTATWNGCNSRGNNVTPGVYFYRLESGDFRATRKLVLMK